jgi:DNA-binding CsgD family transcriptional regulator/PAS domain-containing protein
MREDKGAGRQNPWQHWPAAELLGPRPAASSEEELQRLLDSLLTALKASGALLTLHVDGSRGVQDIGRAGKLTWTEEDWATIAQLAEGAGGARRDSRPGADASDWISCLVNRRAWQVLRVPVGSRRGRSRVTLNFLFRNPNPADREGVIKMVRQLGPLIEGYFRLWQRSRVQSAMAAGLRSALDMVDTGLVLLDNSGKLTFVNKAAQVMLDRGDHIRMAGDLLIPTDINDAVKLQVAINHALAGSADSGSARTRRAPILKFRPERSERPLLLCIFPTAEPAMGPDEPALVLFMLDPNREFDEQLQPVCRLYGLSPVEGRLVCLITGGASLQEAATTMRIKEQTARSYLKMIFMKTDTKRQGDLVRLMLCSLIRTNADTPLHVVD